MYGCNTCIFLNGWKFSNNQNIVYTDSQFMKKKIDFFKIFLGISIPAALFERRSLMMACISSVVASLNEKFPLTLYHSLVFTILR